MPYFTPETDPILFRCSCGRPECDAPSPTPALLARLELFRYRLGRPLHVTSGPRCAFWNAKSGGASTSDHLTGEGADLACPTSRERWELMAENFRGPTPLFERLGIGATFLHVGVTTIQPKLLWTYYPR